MTRFSSPRPSHASPSSTRQLVWTGIGLGVVATALCGSFLFAQPLTGSLAFSPATHDRNAPLGQLFGVNAGSATERGTKVLAGISGETFTPGTNRVAADEIISDGATANIKPVAWDRLSGGGCMNVTTKAGQTFSFRVLGTRPASAKDASAARATVELAIAPCSERAETIVKAVIVPAPEAPRKATAAERNL